VPCGRYPTAHRARKLDLRAADLVERDLQLDLERGISGTVARWAALEPDQCPGINGRLWRNRGLYLPSAFTVGGGFTGAVLSGVGGACGN